MARQGSISNIKRDQALSELRAARQESRGLFWAAGLFSVFVNLLMLTGPLFMLQVYDRVLGSRSEATLLALVLLMAFLFAMMGLLDYARGRILARIGAGFQARLDRRVFSAVLRQQTRASGDLRASNTLRDLEAVQRLLSSPVFASLFDLPWTPVFLLGIAIFHPWLAYLALAGGGVLVLIAILNQMLTSGPVRAANQATIQADHMAEQLRSEAEMVSALGMSNNAFERWHRTRSAALSDTILSSDRAGQFSAMSRTFRMFLQSAILGLGAWLVLRGELTGGAMIAGSILLGRALAPIDMLINQWQLVQRARQGWQALVELLGDDALHLVVDGLQRGLGVHLAPRVVPAQEHLLARFLVGDRPEHVAHADLRHHEACRAGDLPDVAVGAGVDLAEEDLLRHPAAERHADLVEVLLARVVIDVLLGRREGHAQ
ncbi:MAG: ABC transporter transmembrane domain-containing protein, partial [Maritimibacter sp.]